MSAIAGRVLLIPKGNYDSTATYTMLDMVVYNGSSYICKQECTGVVPTNTTYWMLNASGSAVAFLNDIGDVVITNVSNGQVLMYNSTTQKWVNGTLTLNGLNDTQFASLSDGQVLKYNATSQKWENADEAGGILPHLIVISETGSTVTATKGTTVITATETSTGHFECDITEFGTWTIDAVLGGDDAQVSLVVDTVKVYTVDDSHFHSDITVAYPSGATVSCSKTGETTMYATGSPYTFTVHSSGTWTITCTKGGVTRTVDVVISTTGQTESLNMTPTGSTVTPTDDVETLCVCAGVWDSTISTISDLLTDSTSLLAVILSNNAIDYLVRSTTFASDVCANSTAMTDIGLNNYASNTLLADSTWLNAICNSTYFERVLNVKFPTMSSNTTPSGTASANTYAGSGYEAYKAFDNNNSSGWARGDQGYLITGDWVQYISAQNIIPKKYQLVLGKSGNSAQNYTFKIQEDDNGWKDLATITTTTSNLNFSNVISNSSNATKFRLYVSSGGSSVGISQVMTLQLYGRTDV